MLPFAHMGIGAQLVKAWNRGLALRWILVGTLLPDLIDKPLYYGAVLVTGRHGADIGLISGTRTFGHSALFLLALAAFAWGRKSRAGAALALGVATHLLLDNASEQLFPVLMPTGPSSVSALLFPFLGWQFPIMPYKTMGEHIGSEMSSLYISAEVVGAALLGWNLWKRSHYHEIIRDIRASRIARRARAHARKLVAQRRS